MSETFPSIRPGRYDIFIGEAGGFRVRILRPVASDFASNHSSDTSANSSLQSPLSTEQPLPLDSAKGDAIVSPAPCNAGMEKSMSRRRYQRGRIISRGKKRKVWIGIFREDRVREDGTLHRARRTVVLGTVKHVSKLEAIEALRPYLDAVNLVAIPRPKAGRTLSRFVEEWESSVAPTLKPTTVRAAKSHLRTHIIPAL